MSGSVNDTHNVKEDPEIRDAKFFAAVGYLSFLCFVPLVLKKGNPFASLPFLKLKSY